MQKHKSIFETLLEMGCANCMPRCSTVFAILHGCWPVDLEATTSSK
jgi:hypothetical protein